MPTVSTYLDRAEIEKLKRFCERHKTKPYRAIRMLILKGMAGIEQGVIRNEEGLGGAGEGVGNEVRDDIRGAEQQDWSNVFKPNTGKPQPKRGGK